MKKTATTVTLILIFSMLATTVLAYVSLAVMIGPWIDPTLALCALGILSVASWFSVSSITRSELLYATAAGSIGGLVASAAVWSIPTLYFLDPIFFKSLIDRPWYFASNVAALVAVAGIWGFWVAYCTSSLWNNTVRYSFPIAQLVVRTITILGSVSQLLQLCIGVLVTIGYHAAQFFRFIPNTIMLLEKHVIAASLCVPQVVLQSSTFPMLCAIGFIAGNLLVVPLFCGVGIRMLLMEPCYRWYFAAQISEQNFVTAFCTGLVVQGVLHVFGKALMNAPRTLVTWRNWDALFSSCVEQYKKGRKSLLLSLGAVLSVAVAFYCLQLYGKLSIIATIYVISAAGVCAYHITALLGKIGLAPLGRFATFVMVPGMFFFNFNPLQAMLVAAFVELTGAAAATVASGLRIAQEIPEPQSTQRMARYQLFAILVSASLLGALLWFFARYFGFGVAPLLAQRAQSRALLIRAHEMHVGVMVIGIIVGAFLHMMGINTTLLLGGILMSVSDTLLLIVGGLLSRLWREPQQVEPFWSGVFTASSLWMIGTIFLR